MASVQHEPLRFVTSVEAAERLAYGTGRVEILGGFERHIPDVTRAMLADIKFGSLPAITGYDHLLAGFMAPGSRAWNEFFSTRKIVERERGGQKVVSVTSNLHEVLSAEKHLSEPLVQSAEQGLGRERPRKYELAQLLTDVQLLDKFSFPERFLTTVKNLAVAMPDHAAAKLQDFIRLTPGSEKAVVVAGKYARSKKWARTSVKSVASTYPILSVASECTVVDQKIIVYGPSGRESWSVMGPLWYATEVMDVHRMVCAADTSSVMFALGMELVLLDIDIHNGHDFESPSIDYHVGLHDALPDSSSVETSSLLSSTGRAKVEDLSTGLELLEVDGQAVASAVRISPRYVLVNAHVLDKGSVFRVSGEHAYQHRMISKDLWLMRSDCSVAESVWSLRDALVGESVVVMYRRYDKVQLSAPMVVRSTDGVTMFMSLSGELQPGMSGGAVIALTDFALLGVYSGVGAQKAIASVFTQTQFSDVYASDHQSEVGHTQAREVDGATYTYLRDRGLGRVVDAAINSMVPLYVDGVHVGMGVMRGAELITPCDPSVKEFAVGFSGAHATFEPESDGLYKAHLPGLERAGPMLYRSPSYSERVLVMGVDREGPYYNVVDARVVHVGVSARTFLIDGLDESTDLPYEGGLVVSVQDAAVLGLFTSNTVREQYGRCGYCITLRVPDQPVPTALEPAYVHVQRQFPMLHSNLWDEALLEEVFTHGSVQVYVQSTREFNKGMTPLANIGDSAMRLQLGICLREMGVPSPLWSKCFQKYQSTTPQVAVAHKFGLTKLVRVAGGVSLPDNSKVFADVVESLAAAVYLEETPLVFEKFCLAAGLIPGTAEEAMAA